MGWLDDLESKLDGIVQGAFAKTFKGEIQPVEIAAGIGREMDKRASVVARGRTVVPNSFTVGLSPTDFENLNAYGDLVRDELVNAAKLHAEQERYAFTGAVEVLFEQEDDLPIGQYRLHVQTKPDQSGRAPQSPSSAPVPGQPRLDGTGISYGLTRSVTRIGRSADCEVQIEDPGISRRHAEIVLGAETFIRDMNSTNGTFVDDQQVSQAVLRDGSRIQVGSTILVYRAG